MHVNVFKYYSNVKKKCSAILESFVCACFLMNLGITSGLSCLFNGEVQVDAQVMSTDTVLCVAPALATLMRGGGFNGNNSRTSGEFPGQVQLISVELRGAAFKVSRSLTGAKFLRYFPTPTFDFSSTVPGVFVAGGETPVAQRIITVYGTNFNGNVGGMLLRLSTGTAANESSIGQAELIVADTTRATALLPTSRDAGTFRVEMSINSDTWYNPGNVDYVDRPMIQLLTPSTGQVAGGTLVTVIHSYVPFGSLGDLEAKVGQYYVALTRVSETEMTMLSPPHTVHGDPGWFFPGNETVEIYRVGNADARTGTKLRFRFSAGENGTGSRFSYQCSEAEIESKTCCPAGTAGPGGNGGSFCFPCGVGQFAPHVGTTACVSCPVNSFSHNQVDHNPLEWDD